MEPAKLREDLVAYLDGELPADEARAVEAWLAGDAEAQQLRRQLQEDNLALRGLLSAVLREPAPRALQDAIAAPASHRAQTGDRAAVAPFPAGARPRAMASWLAAAAAVCLVVGGLGGFLAGQHQARQELAATAPQPPSWIMQVAEYHRVYAGENRHLVEVAAAETPHIQQWLGKRLDMKLVVPDLEEQGLTFQGARMLVINGAPVAQLIYTPPDGRALALCIIRSPRADKPPTASRQDDLRLVDWRTKGYGFVVVGWEDDAKMRAIAAAAQKSFAL
ncbi:MAG: anti-sigma factor [Dongiaceae bacterium]